MLLPALLYVTFLPAGSDIQGLGISAALASSVGARGRMARRRDRDLGAWILFKTQLDNFEGMVRAITDMLWTGSQRLRHWRDGDVRVVYYGVMSVLVALGYRGAQARPADRPAQDQRKYCRRDLRHRLAPPALYQYAPSASTCAAAPLAASGAGRHGVVLRSLRCSVGGQRVERVMQR